MKFWNSIKELVKPETVYSDPKYIGEDVKMGEVEKTSEQKGEEDTEMKKESNKISPEEAKEQADEYNEKAFQDCLQKAYENIRSSASHGSTLATLGSSNGIDSLFDNYYDHNTIEKVGRKLSEEGYDIEIQDNYGNPYRILSSPRMVIYISFDNSTGKFVIRDVAKEIKKAEEEDGKVVAEGEETIE